MSAPVSEPMVDVRVDEILEQDYGNGWRVVVWNDDYHTFDYVVAVFIKHFGLTPDVAVQKMLEVHNNGQSTLDHGSKSGMEFHALVMETEYGLTATVEKDSDMDS